LTEQARALLGCTDDVVDVPYHNGPLLVQADSESLPTATVLATFETEWGKPHGTMRGKGAIVAGNYGKGRVICFSPHPEKVEALREWVRNAAHFVSGRRSSRPTR
jgi:glutamine amidotransferase-like uncharacterized protein